MHRKILMLAKPILKKDSCEEKHRASREMATIR
jgi:hypothetical protein